MMKKILPLILLAFCLAPLTNYAQKVKVTEEAIKKGKEHVPGFVAVYKHSQATTRETMKGLVKEMGIRHVHHKKGFYVLKGEVWQGISAAKGDYYYKIGGKKRKAKIYFAASKGYDNYVTSANDATTAANITAFLQNLESALDKTELIAEKETELKELEKASAKNAGKLQQTEADKARKQKELDELKGGK